MAEFLKVVMAGVIVALVVDALDKVDPRAALGLATIIVLLILLANRDKVAQLGAGGV